MVELDRFIQAFDRAIRAEMDSMRAQLGAFEIPLVNPVPSDDDGQEHCYAFDLAQSKDKLEVGLECALRCQAGQQLVKIRSIDDRCLVLQCERAPEAEGAACMLIVYPWFLYQSLLASLHSLYRHDAFYPTSALRLFGKAPIDPSHESGMQLDHGDLNASQLGAVELCCRSNAAFVWGPPGTGKTSTLAAILAEMLARGHRTLVVSTTHVAVDQALEKLTALPAGQEAMAAQRIARIGQAPSTPASATLPALVAARHADVLEQLHSLRLRHQLRAEQLETCNQLRASLAEAIRPEQLDLFSTAPAPARSHARQVHMLFSPLRARRLLALESERLLPLLEIRSKRLEHSILLHDKKISSLRLLLRSGQRDIAEKALVLFATMSAAHINRLLVNQRFDVVVIEEAGMAVLPPLFYCACLAARKVIAVGDPRQLPPIIQCKDPFVQRAMGRNIFSVAGADRTDSPFVGLLQTQYRMHPHIGQLISALYYDHLLINDPSTEARAAIAARDPYPGSALVLADTLGTTACSTAGQHSRINRASAAMAAHLAARAAEGGLRSIAIVTPYSEQAKYIRSLIRTSGHDQQAIESSTVHRFQGQERDLVIFDTTDAPPLKPGILLNGAAGADNLINVSLSRACGKLIVLSDIRYFLQRAPKSEIARLVEAMRACCDCHYAPLPCTDALS